MPLQLTATGLDDQKLRGNEFKLFSRSIPAHDVFVIRNVHSTGAEKLVILFEDQRETKSGTGNYLAQIAAEMLMIQYQNLLRFNQPSSAVYCVRVVKRYVSFFALSPTRKQLETVCHGTEEDAKRLACRLQLIHHGPKPLQEKGLDLVCQVERREVLDMLARIRADVSS